MPNDFVTLKAELQLKAGRSNAEFVSLLGNFLNDAIDEITDEMNFWFMKTTISFPLTSADDPAQYQLDSNVKEPDEIYLALTDSFKPLDIVSITDALVRFSPNPVRGEPECVVIENDMMSVFPPPDQDYTLMLAFYSRFDPLVNDEDINFLMANKKKLVMAGALKNAFAFLQEQDDANYWEQQFDKGMLLLRRENNSRVLSGEATLVPKTDIKATINTERFRVGGRGPSGYY